MPVGASAKAIGGFGTGLAIVLLLSGTGAGAGDLEGEQLVAGDWYHAHLTGREPNQIPFFLHIPHDCGAGTASIVNGAERISVPCTRSDATLVLQFPVYGTVIEAAFETEERLAGTWYRELPTGRVELMVLAARKVAAPDPRVRFRADPATSLDDAAGAVAPPSRNVSGVWRMNFELYRLGKGVFDQGPSGVVTGSIEIPSHYGDLSFLAGNVVGDRMFLSTFDGQQAFYIEGSLTGEGKMEGIWIFPTYHDRFVAEIPTLEEGRGFFVRGDGNDRREGKGGKVAVEVESIDVFRCHLVVL